MLAFLFISAIPKTLINLTPHCFLIRTYKSVDVPLTLSTCLKFKAEISNLNKRTPEIIHWRLAVNLTLTTAWSPNPLTSTSTLEGRLNATLFHIHPQARSLTNTYSLRGRILKRDKTRRQRWQTASYHLPSVLFPRPWKKFSRSNTPFYCAFMCKTAKRFSKCHVK